MKNINRATVVTAIAALAVSCGEKEKGQESSATATENKPVAAVSTSPFHADFKTSAKYIDTDAQFMSFKDISGATALIGDALQEIEKEVANGELQIPEGLSAYKLYGKSQLNQIRNMATSSKKVDGGYINKSFVDLGGTRNGVFSVFKGMGKEWSAYEFAPTGTDFIQEFDLNLENLRETLNYVLEGVDEDFKSQVLEEFENNVQKEQALKMMVDGVHARVSLIVRLDKENRIKPEKNVDLPNANMAIRIEGLNDWLKIIDAQLVESSNVKSINGYKYYEPKENSPVPEGVPALSPQLVVNESKNELWISLRSEFLEECLGSGAKLKDDPAFTELRRELPEHGNVLGYLSHDVIKEIDKLYRGDAGKKLKKEMQIESKYADPVEQMVQKLFLRLVGSHALPALLASKSGFVTTTSINKDGIFSISKTPLPDQGQLLAMPVVTAPVLAAIASPIIVRQISRARATQALNNGKDIYIGLRDYCFNRAGDTPGELNDERSANELLRILFSTGVIRDEKPFFVKGVADSFLGDERIDGADALAAGENVYGYVTGVNIFNDSGNTPLLLAPFNKDLDGNYSIDSQAFGGQFIVIYSDGSGAVYSVNEYSDGVYDDRGNLVYKDGKAFVKQGEVTKEYKVAMPE